MPDPAATPDHTIVGHDGIGHAGALLTIDLDAVRANYRLLRATATGAATGVECAAVVKADGYGLGASNIARALWREGCRTFFVAHLQEAIDLRPAIPDARIIVLHGPTPGAEPVFLHHDITPVLNTPQQVAGWAGLARATAGRAGRAPGTSLAALLQFDTGMSRFGLSEPELHSLLQSPDSLAGIELLYVISHLACADTPDHPANAAQLASFNRMRAHFPGAKASLSASSGIFLGPAYCFDLVRPGAALYGIAPVPGRPNPMQPVVRLQARVVQVRCVPAGTAIGYGHTATARRPTRLATAAVGYADGFPRSSGTAGAAYVGDTRLPLIGRVSMDSIILDATDLIPPIAPDSLVDLIGPHHDLDAAAQAAGTIGYELLTGLGRRYARRILGS